MQPIIAQRLDANDADNRTFMGQWVQLTVHLEHVMQQAGQLAAQVGLSANHAAALIEAAVGMM